MKGRSSPMRRRFFTFRGTPAAKANSFARGRATEPPATEPLGGPHMIVADETLCNVGSDCGGASYDLSYTCHNMKQEKSFKNDTA